MMERERFVALFEADRRILASKIFEAVQKSLQNAAPVSTDFLDPGERKELQEKLRLIPGLRVLSCGGFREAERQRLIFIPSYYFTEMVKPGITALEARLSKKGAGTEEPLHRDYLGALLALGIKREKCGDLWVIRGGCQVVLDEEIAPFAVHNWREAGSCRLECDIIDLEGLKPPAQKSKIIRTTVPSLRLDAVASSGFAMSRSKMLEEIKAGKMKVNWRETVNPSQKVAEGDVISMRGRGRMVLAEVGGSTKKERIFLTLERFF
ncbi:MAG: RNA-binding protein [Bacillota bacterium]